MRNHTARFDRQIEAGPGPAGPGPGPGEPRHDRWSDTPAPGRAEAGACRPQLGAEIVRLARIAAALHMAMDARRGSEP